MYLHLDYILNKKIPFLSEKFSSLTAKQEKVNAIAIPLFCCLALLCFYYICRFWVKVKPKPKNELKGVEKEVENKKIQHIQKEKISQKNEKLNVPFGKKVALTAYEEDPANCSQKDKTIIYKDIKNIKMSYGQGQPQLTSVEGLMKYLSGLDKIDLHHEKCKLVVLDTLRECNKETSKELAEWLQHESSFHVSLLKECLEVLINKQKEGKPVNLYTLELLVKSYQQKKWNQPFDQHNPLILPLNDPLLVSTMKILIEAEPNEDRIKVLTEWFLNQQEFAFETFVEWAKIFQQKEIEKGKPKEDGKPWNVIYYNLLKTITDHALKKWGSKAEENVDPKLNEYLKAHLVVAWSIHKGCS